MTESTSPQPMNDGISVGEQPVTLPEALEELKGAMKASTGNIVTRAMFSALLAFIVAGLSGFTAYAIMGGIENTVLEPTLLIALYLVSPVVLSVLRSIRRWTFIDFILLHIFGLAFAIIAFQYASSAIALGTNFLPWV